MRIKFSLILGLLVIMSGCVQNSQIQPVNEGELNGFTGGNSTIIGHAFLRNSLDELWFCGGENAYLVPSVPHTQSFYETYYQGRNNLYSFHRRPNIKLDSKVSPYIKVAPCDMDGNFKFTNVADGTYFIETVVKSPDGTKSSSVYDSVVVDSKLTHAIISGQKLNFIEQKDNFSGSTVYTYQIGSEPLRGLKPTVFKDSSGKVTLLAPVYHTYGRWIFLEKAQIKIDNDPPVEFKLELIKREVLSGGAVEEVGYILDSESLLRKIARGKKVTVRMIGERGRLDYIMSANDIEGVKWILSQYDTLRKKP